MNHPQNEALAAMAGGSLRTRVAAVQMVSTPRVADNLATAAALIDHAAHRFGG